MEYRKYNNDFRKKLITKFNKLKNKIDYIDLYNIIYEDIGNNYSSNMNGLFINMNILSNNCIDKLNNFINSKLNVITIQNDEPNYISYKLDDVEIISEKVHKLSNQEKNIIKRIRDKHL
jgi:hypothetical protein